MVLSLLPPPVARRFGCHGHQAIAYIDRKDQYFFYKILRHTHTISPPPLKYFDHQPTLTAAWCPLSTWAGSLGLLAFQIHTRLSFPPLASLVPSGDHFSPHTSSWWYWEWATMCSALRTSWWWMTPSRQPLKGEDSPFNQNTDTNSLCTEHLVLSLLPCFLCYRLKNAFENMGRAWRWGN